MKIEYENHDHSHDSIKIMSREDITHDSSFEFEVSRARCE